MPVDKRERILEAAAFFFTEHGYEKTSMADIGARVGMNKASLYYHFRDKQALFAAFVAERRAVHLVARERTLSALSAGPERILALIEAELDFVSDLSLNFFATNAAESKHDATAPVLTPIIEEDATRVAELLREWPGLGEDSPEPSALASSILLVARGLLLADCPFELPRDERPAAYRRIRDRAKAIVALMLKGASR